jgi:bifunctional UDP-N-acetylglucosamine pyrophosphorylase/glucosamine-1-phosphate N-acetyltransferase
MKAIILAAGEWTRLKPLTNTVPKPLIKIFWKPIMEHNLEYIYKYVSEIIIIVKYKWDLIKNYFQNDFKWTKITYKEQWLEKWTWAAIKWICFNEDVLILNWDSIFDKKDLKNLINFNWYWVLVKKVESSEKYWIFKIKENNRIEEIIEKPKKFVWNLASLWLYKFNSKIFEYIDKIGISIRWEYELTDALNLYVKDNELKTINIKWEFIDIWYPWDIIKANYYFLSKLKKSDIKWTVESGVNINWNIILESGAVLKSWTYIEWNVYIWKNSIIWPNSYIRKWSVIWNNCRIWNAVEVKESIFWDNSNAAHLSYIWNSIVWNNVNIAWGFISANLRHDNSNIKVTINWNLTDTWLNKFWCIIWDNTKTWINTSTFPWRIIENGSITMPWEVIK